MTRRNDQLNRIEASLARLEEAVNGHAGVLRDQLASVRADANTARQSAEAAHAGVQALHDMIAAIPDQAPQPPSEVPPAAGGRTAGEAAPAARRAPTQPRHRM